MALYVAYGLIVMHVALGVMQYDRNPLLPGMLIVGFAALTSFGLYLMDFEMHPKRAIAGILAMMIGAIGLIVVTCCAPSRAHDHNRPELDDWFKARSAL